MTIQMLLFWWLCQFIIKLSTKPAIVESYPECGKRLEFDIGGTIRKGVEADKYEFPWMVFLYNFDRSILGGIYYIHTHVLMSIQIFHQ